MQIISSTSKALVLAFACVDIAFAKVYNCPGALNVNVVNDNTLGYCCIGSNDDSCDTTIPVTATNYDALVSSASSKYMNINISNGGSGGAPGAPGAPGSTDATTTSITSQTTTTLSSQRTNPASSSSTSAKPAPVSTTVSTTITVNSSTKTGGAGKLDMGFAMGALAFLAGAALL
ncbi:unnamed protein product [Clonostachys rosea]|uniref:Hydrophobin n=1 Tax=Bionectria ochroleuca TaxID=29856 RepID=A0ABY6U7Y1_BIOOC|nr:unnamed protein product [Clonostachys rosea]